MGTISDAVNQVWRDFVTTGVPSSGLYEPEKSTIRTLGPVIETAIANVGFGALVDVAYSTRALLEADLNWPENSVALTYGDATDANNDLSIKVGASGSGSWTLTTILHDIVATVVADEVSELVDPKVALAEEWADNPEDDEITGNAGKFSAKHHALKAAAQASLAQIAAGQATTMVLDPIALGPGQAMATTNTSATNYTNSVIINQLIPAGTLLDTLELSIAASGAGALKLFLSTLNSDATENNLTDLDDVVVGTTGWVPLNLRKTGAGYVTTADSYLGFQRSGSTAATFNHRTGSSGVSRSIAGKLTGSNQATAASSVLPAYKIRGSVARKGQDLYDRSIRNGSALGHDQAAPVVHRFGRRRLATGSSFNATTTAFFDYERCPRSGFLKWFTLDVTVAGAAALHLMSQRGASVYLERTIFVVAATSGVITFHAGTDFDDNVRIDKGWWRGVTPMGATIRSGGTGNGGLYSLAHPIVAGVARTLTDAGSGAISIEIGVESVAEPLSTLVETLDERLRGVTKITHEFFRGTATPSLWTLGGWTVNNGLISPATGNMSTVASMNTVRYATRATYYTAFNVTRATTGLKFGFGGTGETGGQLIRMNAVTQALEICTWNGSGNAATVITSEALTFTVPFGSAARPYTLMARRRINRTIVILRDVLSGEQVILDEKGNKLSRLMGQPCYVFEAGSGTAGDVVVTSARWTMDVSPNDIILASGDSLADGWALDDKNMPAVWDRVAAIRNRGDMLVVARFGIATTALLAEMIRVLALVNSVRIGIVLCGGNDGTQSTVDANLTSMVTKIAEKGGTPYLCTLTPKASVGAIITDTNAAIHAGTYGSHGVIDFHRALSDGSGNWNSAYVLSDLVHINGPGYALLASADENGLPQGVIWREAPEIYEGCIAGAGMVLA